MTYQQEIKLIRENPGNESIILSCLQSVYRLGEIAGIMRAMPEKFEVLPGAIRQAAEGKELKKFLDQGAEEDICGT